MTQYILKRFSETAALFLQPGFLCDLLVLPQSIQTVHCFTNVPLDYVYEKWLMAGGRYYTSLEYGHYEGSPRHMVRDPDPYQAHNDIYLHPVVYVTLLIRSKLPSYICQKTWRIAGFPASTLLYEQLKFLASLVPRMCWVMIGGYKLSYKSS